MNKKKAIENLARIVAAAFVTPLDPTCEELSEIKTAVSEAVTNAIIHGYEDSLGMVRMDGKIIGNVVEFVIYDKGCGISDIPKAMEPLYTGKPELERSGLGLTVSMTLPSSPISSKLKASASRALPVSVLLPENCTSSSAAL